MEQDEKMDLGYDKDEDEIEPDREDFGVDPDKEEYS